MHTCSFGCTKDCHPLGKLKRVFWLHCCETRLSVWFLSLWFKCQISSCLLSIHFLLLSDIDRESSHKTYSQAIAGSSTWPYASHARTVWESAGFADHSGKGEGSQQNSKKDCDSCCSEFAASRERAWSPATTCWAANDWAQAAGATSTHCNSDIVWTTLITIDLLLLQSFDDLWSSFNAIRTPHIYDLSTVET